MSVTAPGTGEPKPRKDVWFNAVNADLTDVDTRVDAAQATATDHVNDAAGAHASSAISHGGGTVAGAIDGKLAIASNLSDLASAATARDNLGLGDAATQDAADLPVSTAQAVADALTTKSLSFDLAKAASLDELVGTDPRIMDVIGDWLYGVKTGSLYRTQDEDGPWELVHNFGGQTPAGGIKEAGDGEVLVARATEGLWKSTGWASNPLTATWQQVLNTDGSQIAEFTWDADPTSGHVVVTTYDVGDMSKSRYVWFSDNNGATFAVVFDMAVEHPTLAQATAHMHLAKFDTRWSAVTPRIWVSYHKTSDDPTNGTDPLKRLIYSDNNGASWTVLSTVDQPVTGISVERGMIFSSDTDPTALHIVPRTTNPADMTVKLLFRRRANVEALYGWGIKAVYGTDPRAVHVAFRSSVAGFPGGVVTTDGWRAVETLTIPAAAAGDQVAIVDVVVFEERLLGTYYQTTTHGANALRFRADEPIRGVPPADDNGLAGGSAGNLSIAAGLNAAASGFRAAALGTNSSAANRGVAIGDSAVAPIEGVAIGQAANPKSTTGVAIGRNSTTGDGVGIGWSANAGATAGVDGTAIGRSSAASLGEGTAIGTAAEAGVQGVAIGRIAKALSDQAVAIGRGAVASALAAVAIGRSTTASHDRALAMGFGSVSTAADQVAVGGRHLEVRIAPTPAAPAASTTRHFARLDANGKIEWCSRFPTGAVQIVATEVGVGRDPVFTTAARPTPAAAGVGARYFDSTLGKPAWSTGSAWVDAAGTAV